MRSKAFPHNFIEEVRAASDIVAVISDYVRLKKTGQNFVGLCPFHTEETPSFTVNRQRQMYYCFGCNAGGDVFEFIMKKEGLDFPAAMRLLADRAHLHIPQQSPAARKRESERQALYYVGELAQKYYESNLDNRHLGAQARSYLKRRGLDQDIINRFGLGFAPDEWEGAIRYLNQHGVAVDTAVKAGLAIPRPKGTGAYDRFRGRIMFPIRDSRGRVVAFGGRMLGPGEPKYLNSPETPIYSKGKLLYALDQARSGIQRADAVLITEGYLDVLACHQFGFNYAVASLGTALTIEQLLLLKRFTINLLIGYDADRAGQAATVRGLELARHHGFQVRILMLPLGEDPDDVIRSHGAESFARLVEQAVSVPAYHFQRLLANHDTGDLEGRLAIAQAMVPHLAGIKNLVEREEYTKKVAQNLDLDQHLFKAQVQTLRRRQAKHSLDADKPTVQKQSLLPATHRAEIGALVGLGTLFLNYPEVRTTIAESISEKWLSDSPQAAVIKAMLTLFKQVGSDFCLSRLKELLPDEGACEVLARLSVQPIPVGDPVVLSSHFAHRIKLISVQREIGSLRQQINSWKRAGKTEDSANLIRRLADLHHQEVLLKQPSPGLCRSRNGLMEGGIRHAEKG